MQVMFAAAIASVAHYSLTRLLPGLQEFPATSSFRQGVCVCLAVHDAWDVCVR
jgi:hypothetical protein